MTIPNGCLSIFNPFVKKAMFIDNLSHQMSFIDSKEAGKFLAFLEPVPLQAPSTLLLKVPSHWQKF